MSQSPAEKRLSLWRVIPYVSGIPCDICLGTDKVKTGCIPVVLCGTGLVVHQTPLHQRWTICDQCFLAGGGLLSTRSVNFSIVYQRVEQDGDVRRARLVLAPLMFRDRLF